MADVKFTGTSDFEKVKKDYESLARHTAKVESENQKLRRTSDQVGNSFRRTNRTHSRAMSSAVSSVKSLALQYVGVQAAIQLVNKELEHSKMLSERALQATMTTAAAESAVIKNIGDVPDPVASQFIQRTKDISQQAGLPDSRSALTAASSILSATAGDREKTLAIIKAAAPFFRDTPEDLAQFGGAMGDVMKVTGGTAKDTAALMLAIQGQARFETLAAFKEVAPALASASVVTKGDRVQNTRETAALFAAIGSRAGDVEGATTKTAVANLTANLARVVPELDTTFARLQKVQQDPKLQAEVAKSGFRGSIKPIIEELLAGSGTQTSMMVQDAFQQIQGSNAAYTRKLSQLGGLTPALQEQTSSMRSSGNLEAYRTTPGASRMANIRDILNNTLDETTLFFGTIDTWIRKGVFEMQARSSKFATPEEAAMSQLFYRRAAILDRKGASPREIAAPPTASEMAGLEPQLKKMVNLLTDQLNELRAMKARNQSNADRAAAQRQRTANVVE
jgi:hypothetical protein